MQINGGRRHDPNDPCCGGTVNGQIGVICRLPFHLLELWRGEHRYNTIDNRDPFASIFLLLRHFLLIGTHRRMISAFTRTPVIQWNRVDLAGLPPLRIRVPRAGN